MNKQLITLILLVLYSSLNAQNFKKEDFINTEWFTDNRESFFLKSDTIRLIKYTNVLLIGENSVDYKEDEIEYLGHNSYIHFGFKRNMNLELGEQLENGDFIKNINGLYTWGFDKKNSLLYIFKDKILFRKLKIISKRQIDIGSGGWEETLLKTTEYMLVNFK
jgi:hypothetical protein